ncbi:MAG: hypothetical protein IJH34_07170 [Romboutsia sp.]|nr:hypothetical protein [Romboutsia sp.]
MEIGRYIEHKLKEKKLTKLWLYNQLKNTFHKSDNKFLNYNSFSIKLSNNRLKATELIEISCILDLNLNQLKRYLINTKNHNLNSNTIESNITQIILNNSHLKKYTNLDCTSLEKLNSDNLISNIIEIDKNVFNFFIYSKEFNIAILELFNLNNKTFVKLYEITNLNLFLLEKNLCFSDLSKLSKKELLNILMLESEEYFLLYPKEIPIENHLVI